MARLFVGVPVPESFHAACDAVNAALAKQLKSRIGWVKPGNFHVTLQFIGALDEAYIPDITTALSRLAHRRFTMRPGWCECVPNALHPAMLWVRFFEGSAQCEALAQAVEACLLPFGIRQYKRPYRCHTTLGRVREAANDDFAEVLGHVQADWQSFPVERLTLWLSDLQPTGAEYTPLAEFPLLP